MKTGFVFAAAAGSLALSSITFGQADGPQLGIGSLALNKTQQMQAAAVPPPPPSMFTVRGGVLVPLNSRVSDISPVLLGVGVDYTFSNAYFRDAQTFFSADWLIRTRGSTRFNLFPINLNERFYLSNRNNPDGMVSYAFIGFGATFFDFQGTGNSWRFGGRGGFGVDLGPAWVAEIAAYATSAFHGVQGDALGLYIGYKFGG